MEILMLILLYYLSQNPDFAESAKPLMEKLKNSQQILSFLGDLSRFSQTFVSPTPPPQNPTSSQNVNHEKNTNTTKNNPTSSSPHEVKQNDPPASPSTGIADEFIQNLLDSYLKKH